MRTKLILALAMSLSLCVSCATRPRRAAGQFPLVKDGAARATIVVPAAATTNELRAASELAAYLAKISGATLPIANEPLSSSSCSIYVGNTGAFAREGITIPRAEMSDEGFIITANSRGLFLAGSTDPCTLFAVYDFLETLGCRFYFPGELGEVIPRRKTIVIPALRIAEQPALVSREFWLWGYKVRSKYENGKLTGFTAPLVTRDPGLIEWATKNKAGGASFYSAHGWARIILPPGVFFESHPEYYALVKGRRNSYQLCSTNPDVIRLYIEAARLFFDQHPGQSAFSLSPNDGPLLCECDNCRALDDPKLPGDHGRRLAIFVNTVAREVMKTHPDKFLIYLATYTDDLRSPPADIAMERNVIPKIVNESRYVREWAAKGLHPMFYLWVFDPTATGFPFVDTLHTVPEEVLAAQRAGAIGVMEEAHHTPFNFPALYLSMQLAWDGPFDLAAARRQFFRDFFGPAAKTMQTYWTTLGRARELRELDRCRPLLDNARRRAGRTQPYAARLELVRQSFEITYRYFALETLAQTALETGRATDLQKFGDCYRELLAGLDTGAGRSLSNRDQLLARVQSTFGVLAGARPRYSRLQSATDFWWGDFDYKVDGLMRAAEAIHLTNLHVRSQHLALPPRAEGRIEWEFRAPPGRVFERAEADVISVTPPGAQDEAIFEISTDDGKTYRIVLRSHRPEAPLDLSALVKDHASFRLRLRCHNSTDQSANFLEDLRIQLRSR